MNCPVDGTTLAITERSGIEIDYCPQCRGVWLDRGELDKIIDRAEAQMTPAASPPPQAQYQQPPQPQYRDDRYDDRYDPRYNQGHGQHGHYKKKKKGGFLSEMFDFD